ncbi:MAG: exodeoxyribonuclease VII small subunit [Desulfovibrionaceae bacterium CG1_02_65_16]|nr:MAG: exodeoxyribonuclease VII small subunit [Desulfovibrionaceae bacterium CG1_02_65_16]
MAKEKQSFEKRLERLKSVVDALERGELPLEQSLALYKEGLTLSADLGRQLTAAKNEVRLAQDGLLKEFADVDAPGAAGRDAGDAGDGEATA